MSEFLTFMRGRVVEMVLLTVAAAALFSTVTYGFHVEDQLRAAYPAIILLPLCLTAYFTAISYTPRSVIVGSIAFAVAFGIVAAVLGAASGHAFFYDEYGNIGFFVLIGTVVTVLGHVLTRRRALCFVYAVGGCFTCGLVQFLYLNGLLVQALVFLLDAVCLCVVCVNRVASKGIAADDVPPWRFLGVGAAVAGVSVLLAAAVFALVVVPLNPPAREIKLFTEYFALETVHVRGEQMVEHKEDEEQVSNVEAEDDKQTNEVNDGSEDVTGELTGGGSQGSAQGGDAGGQGYSITGFGRGTAAVDFPDDPWTWLLVIPILLLLVAGTIACKLLLRRRRHRRMLALPARERALAYYRFFDKRLPLLGVTRARASTPLEHAGETSATVGLLERDAEGATYLDLARTYSACAYGAAVPTEDELEEGERLYRVFFRNARRLVGAPRYLTRFFRL